MILILQFALACVQSESYADRTGQDSLARVGPSTPPRDHCHSIALQVPKMVAFDRSPIFETTSKATGVHTHRAIAPRGRPLQLSNATEQQRRLANPETPSGSKPATDTVDPRGGPRDLGPSLGQMGPCDPELASAAAGVAIRPHFDKPALEGAEEVLRRTAAQTMPPGQPRQLSDGRTKAAVPFATGTVRTAQLAPTSTADLEEALHPPLMPPLMQPLMRDVSTVRTAQPAPTNAGNFEEALHPPVMPPVMRDDPMVRSAEQLRPLATHTPSPSTDDVSSHGAQQPPPGSADHAARDAAHPRQPPRHKYHDVTHQLSTNHVSSHVAPQPPVNSWRVANGPIHPPVDGSDDVEGHVTYQEPPKTCLNQVLSFTCGLALVPVKRSRKNAL